MTSSLQRFVRDDSGQGLVEYALIIALLSIVAVASLQMLGTNSNTSLNNAGSSLS